VAGGSRPTVVCIVGFDKESGNWIPLDCCVDKVLACSAVHEGGVRGALVLGAKDPRRPISGVCRTEQS